VIHAAAYISDVIARNNGEAGAARQCVRRSRAGWLIEPVQGGTLVLAYYPDRSWLQNSKLACLDASAR
jgi:hypothetical protein